MTRRTGPPFGASALPALYLFAAVAAVPAGPHAPAATTLKIVSAAVPNGMGEKMNVKIGYACSQERPVVLTVTTTSPTGSGRLPVTCTTLAESSIITVVTQQGQGLYASGTAVQVDAVAAVQDGGGVPTKFEQRRAVTPS